MSYQLTPEWVGYPPSIRVQRDSLPSTRAENGKNVDSWTFATTVNCQRAGHNGYSGLRYRDKCRGNKNSV